MTDPIMKNPCAEVQLTEFAKATLFHMPMFGIQGQQSITKEKTMRMFEYEDGMFINMEHVVSYFYELDLIHRELSTADIYSVEIHLTMSSGEEYVVDEAKKVLNLARELGDRGNCVVTEDKGLIYYAVKFLDYSKLVEEKEKNEEL